MIYYRLMRQADDSWVFREVLNAEFFWRSGFGHYGDGASELYIYECSDDGGEEFRICSSLCGGVVARGRDEAAAIRTFDRIYEKHGIKGIRKQIRDTAKKQGFAPGFNESHLR